MFKKILLVSLLVTLGVIVTPKHQICKASNFVKKATGVGYVTCCCETSDGGMCCAEVMFCGSYIPGCWCR